MSAFVPSKEPPITTRLATKVDLEMNKRVDVLLGNGRVVWGRAEAVTSPRTRTTMICFFPGPMDELRLEDLVIVLTHETLHIAVGDDDPSSVEILNRGLCRIERDWKFISAWREASSLDDNAYRVGLVWNARARGMSIKRIAARVHRPRRWVRHIIKSSRALERES